jgi:hypothetical protein
MNVPDLIGEIARRHNVLVSADDPVLVGVTLNELLLAEHVRRIEGSLERAKASLDALSARRLAEARWVAEQVVAKGAREAGEQVRLAGSDIRSELERVILDGLVLSRTAEEEAREHRRVAYWSAVVACGCSCLVLGFELARWFRGG